MTVQYGIGAGLLAAFILMVAIRAATLQRKGIRAFMFGVTEKSDFLLVPCVLLMIYTGAAALFGLPMWPPFVAPFWKTAVPGWAGVVLCAASVAGIAATLRSFGDSFRVGIDEDNPDKLITTGMFSISRNPIYTCFIIFFAGLFLIYKNAASSLWLVFFILIAHRQIIREEIFLRRRYGADFDVYCERVRRYL